MNRPDGGKLLRVVPVVLVVIVAVIAWWWLRSDDGSASPQPVAINAAGPVFGTIDELVAGSDLVVRATVTDVDEGRSITDPSDPSAGIRTQLARVEVTEILVGAVDGPLVVEQEAFLLDGSPLTVNGVAAVGVGDEGLMFLQVGDSDEFPYTAFVNEQGWVPIVDDRITPTDPVDPLWSMFADQSAAAVITRVSG